MKRFYTNLIIDKTAYLQAVEASHCAKVLRCRMGDTVECMNGSGVLYKGIISEIKKHEVLVELAETIEQQAENSIRFSIALPLVKNPARLEWFVEKATEIGIAHIYPILTERTEKSVVKTDRLNQIIISAAKQSRQLFFPKLHATLSFEKLITNVHYENKFIAHCEDEKLHFAKAYRKNEQTLLLIGPEGDFTKQEIEMALNKNYKPVSLGNSILRVETAGVAACAMAAVLNEL